MNKRQKIVQQQFLDNEEAVIKRLKQSYSTSLRDINKKAQKLHEEIESLAAVYDDIEDEAEKAVLKSRIQSKVYQKQYQESLQKQVGDILGKMHREEFKTVSAYLDKCYEDGFVGTMYDLQGQSIPLCFPLDQEAMVRAVQLDSKISQGLYSRLGEDVAVLKKKITAQVSRGIATGMTFNQVAQQLSAHTRIGFNNAVRIARTEGHRIQCQSGMDACYKAKEKGADVVKQWDSTLDGSTRESHIQVDGEIRELDEKFSNGLMFPGDPSGGAAEVVNCRCALLQRASCAVAGSFTKMNNFTKQLETFESPEKYSEFKEAFFSKENKKYMNYVRDMEEKYGTTDFEKVLGMMNDREYQHYSGLLGKNPIYNKKALTNSGNSGKMSVKNSTSQSTLIGGVDVTINEKIYNFGDGTAKGIMKTCDAVVYTTKDGTNFVFPKVYDKSMQTMTPEQAIAAWQRVPENIRKKAQKTIEFVDYYNPQDAYWKKVYKNFPNSYATGGDTITFYRYEIPHNDVYITRTYCHEAGHYIDTQLATSANRYSEEALWTKAMADDLTLTQKKSCTTYGENSPVEDFAESIAEFVNDEATFTTSFPNRAALIKGIL